MIENTVASVISFVRGLIDDQTRTDGRDSYIYSSSNIFTLTEDFVSSSTIAVFKNGVELSGGDYTYDSDNNTITISVSLSENDTILITYDYYKKYSDTELKGYLASSLVYFPQYRYKKTFQINADDKIVAVNNYDPTTNELYFIVTIASIVVDPQNIRITIPDLGISPKRDMSDQEQIKVSFRNFMNFVGTINFEALTNLYY